MITCGNKLDTHFAGFISGQANSHRVNDAFGLNGDVCENTAWF